MSDLRITEFRDEFSFLSNFYSLKFRYKGHTYRTAEHAFQAQKAINRRDFLAVKQAATPGQAKRIARKIRMREDWDLVRVTIMFEVVRAKFQDPELRTRLVATGDAHLEEGNYWGDRFWGTCNGKGQNWLGKILMQVREEIA